VSGISAWSFSRWRKYDTCPYSAYLAYVEKLPEEAGPAMARGSRIHAELEEYLCGGNRLPPEALNFQRELEALKSAVGLRSEEQWAFDGDWNSCDWFARHCWLRMKVDARYGARDEGVLTIIDFKTGCKPPREPSKYDELQKEIYAVGAHAKFGDALREVRVEYWYVDRPAGTNIFKRVFHPEDLEALRGHWEAIGRDLCTLCASAEWPKTPGPHCNWCSFHERRGGPCDGIGEEEVGDDGAF
jgi:RecB family exonuclease